MAVYEDYQREMARLESVRDTERAARQKFYEMHGGDNPHPYEPPMPRIIAQFGEWAVTEFGIECLTHPYEIQWDAITDSVIDDEYWLRNLAKKDWVKLDDFAEALRHGRRIHAFLHHLPAPDDDHQEHCERMVREDQPHYRRYQPAPDAC